MKQKKETRGRKKTVTKRQAVKNHTAAQNRWNAANTKIVNVRFNLADDADVLQKLGSVSNKTDYLRRLIRADIVANGFDE